MYTKKLFGAAVAATLLMAMLMATFSVVLVEAKSTYITPSGHKAVRYYSWDIPKSLRPYISMIEYDLAYEKGKGYGVRLYLTNLGMEKGKEWYSAKLFAWYIRANSEWPTNGRSETSVAREIWVHCKLGITVMAIEYYYEDLDWWYRSLYGR